ncbi:MAG: hypothetical protein K1Y02_03155 [Candidatus Hydrogenedentes bacterium]|nr:hypothetical protein [Candidatus Hydrogenedentota bacterium]
MTSTHRTLFVFVVSLLVAWTGLLPGLSAQETPPDLRLSVYLTTDSVHKMASDAEARAKALSVLQPLHISRVFLEIYRGGDVVDRKTLESARDFFRENGFQVTGGIATVPGGEIGVRQEGPLGWFNWQNPKTQEDIRRIIADAAPVFDELIVDDFFCTGDVSAESQAAKGDRSWSDYRRDLMVGLAKTVIIDPAKQANPGIRVIIKFPQWYDRFHEFGYDVPRESALFDGVWVGTETRGATTQRFGFVQPYEGFVNFRWVASIAGDKTLGAWFDHGDCDADDFIEQAYQSVLAGAPELTLFSYGAFEEGHPGHEKLAKEFDSLNALSKAVRTNPIQGLPAYKPANSDSGSDMYIMDYIGMLGIPLVPVSTFPDDAPCVFLPTQAASDSTISAKIADFVASRKTIILTTGFIVKAQSSTLNNLAGLRGPVVSMPLEANAVLVNGQSVRLSSKLNIGCSFTLGDAAVLVYAMAGEKKVPLLTLNNLQGATVIVVNTCTFTQADFDAVGEVLLAPKWLGILDLPQPSVEVLRRALSGSLGANLLAPVRTSLQTLSNNNYIIQNYNGDSATVSLLLSATATPAFSEAWSTSKIPSTSTRLDLTIPARSRVWVTPDK